MRLAKANAVWFAQRVTASQVQLPPVTVLCGFLGAGKTTVLQHLLRQAAGRRWAAVVNDLASLNIDGRLIERAGASRVVELGNGCVCCTVRNELAETIAELAATGGYEHIFVETTGVAEPRGIAALFTRPNAFKRKLGDFARLHALVTVVDAAQWSKVWREIEATKVIPIRHSREPREVAELMVEQIECADVLVLNKTDLVDAPEQAKLVEAMREMNPRAEVVAVCEGAVPVDLLPGAARFDEKATIGAARWLRVLAEDHGGKVVKSTGRVSKWSTLVFREQAPFVAEKFDAFLAQPRPGMVRAKGFYWVAEHPSDMSYLSLAGSVMRREAIGTWVAALLERGVITREEIPASAQEHWREPHGDRRQELVFIGINFDAEKMRAELTACLASY